MKLGFVGLPNVGKPTLFNALAGSKNAKGGDKKAKHEMEMCQAQ